MNGERGFTITELLIAMIVSLLVSIAGWGFYRTQLRSLTDQAASLDATESARAAMGFMAREIRRTALDPQGTAFTVAGAKGVSLARGDTLVVEWDENSSGAIDATASDPNAESIRYAYDATNERILRTVNGVETTLIENVPAGGLAYQYFNASGTLLPLSGSPPELTAAQRDTVAAVGIALRVRADTTNGSSIVALSSRATLRNRILGRL